MRLTSNKESRAKGEISLLAVVETILAMGIVVFVFLKENTLLPLAISASLAPFLLLRTTETTDLAVRMLLKLDPLLGRFADLVDKFDSVFWQLLVLVTVYVFLGVCVFVVRLLSIIISVSKHPLLSIREIPQNWYRITMTIDFLHPPEAIPGIENVKDNESKKIIMAVQWEQWVEELKIKSTSDIFLFIALLPFLVITYFPSLLYRFSIKSTSLIYLPFLWFVGNRPRSEKQFNIDLTDFLDSQIEKVRRAYAWFVLIVLTAIPIYIFLAWQKVVAALKNIDRHIFLFRPHFRH